MTPFQVLVVPGSVDIGVKGLVKLDKIFTMNLYASSHAFHL